MNTILVHLFLQLLIRRLLNSIIQKSTIAIPISLKNPIGFHQQNHQTFLLTPPTSNQMNELCKVIQQVKASSTPSPVDQLPYQIFKKCPSLLPALLDLYNLCWRESSIPHAWKNAIISLIPKKTAVEHPENPANFCPNRPHFLCGKHIHINIEIMATDIHDIKQLF